MNWAQAFTGGSFQDPSYLLRNSNMGNYGVNPNLVASVNPLEQFYDSTYGVEDTFSNPYFQTATGGSSGGGFGSLLGNIFNPSKWTPGGVGMFGSAAKGIGALGGLYLGAKNYGLTKDMLSFQKKLGRANFENQAAMAQKHMDRGRLYRRALGGVKGEPRTKLRTTI